MKKGRNKAIIAIPLDQSLKSIIFKDASVFCLALGWSRQKVYDVIRRGRKITIAGEKYFLDYDL